MRRIRKPDPGSEGERGPTRVGVVQGVGSKAGPDPQVRGRGGLNALVGSGGQSPGSPRAGGQARLPVGAARGGARKDPGTPCCAAPGISVPSPPGRLIPHPQITISPLPLPSVPAQTISLFCCCCCCFLGLNPQHMEVPQLGVTSKMQLLAYTTATAKLDLSHVCYLHQSSWQCGILNPLGEATHQTCNLMDTSQVHYQ